MANRDLLQRRPLHLNEFPQIDLHLIRSELYRPSVYLHTPMDERTRLAHPIRYVATCFCNSLGDLIAQNQSNAPSEPLQHRYRRTASERAQIFLRNEGERGIL